MGLWESNSGFGDHVRAQAVDDDLLVINFIPLGVKFWSLQNFTDDLP